MICLFAVFFIGLYYISVILSLTSVSFMSTVQLPASLSDYIEIWLTDLLQHSHFIPSVVLPGMAPTKKPVGRPRTKNTTAPSPRSKQATASAPQELTIKLTVNAAKDYLGFKNLGKVYSGFRADMKAHVKGLGIAKKSDAGTNQWNEILRHAQEHKALRSAKKKFQTEPEIAEKYLSYLMMDIVKKRKESADKADAELKDAGKEEDEDGDADGEDEDDDNDEDEEEEDAQRPPKRQRTSE